ncbi:MAG: rod shape-determining protein MreC, partial [Proteobacteria bacterium]|nr:rod shape-determining protein MreC [Pseudomonadota bacterium]
MEGIRVPVTWAATAALILCGLVAATLLLNDRRDEMGLEGWGAARTGFDRVAAPAGGVVSAPVRWTGGAFGYMADYWDAVGENRRLKRRLREMEKLRAEVVALRDVNQRYASLLRLRTDPPAPMVAAHVVLDARGPSSTTRLANAGTEKRIRPGHPVMSEHGLVGRVAGVTRGASRVLLLTDPASRTPVLIDRTNARAILTGDGGPNPRLEFLRGAAPAREGDAILTSGDGGVFPRGLPVGVAVKGVDGVWRARLYSDRAPIDYVRVLLFDDFSRLVNQRALVDGVPAVIAPPAQPGPPPPAAARPQPQGAPAAAARPR